MYRFFYDDAGVLSAIATMDGASLPFDPTTKIFLESHPLTIELRDWEKANGEIDLSDRKPDLEPEKITYRLNTLLPEDKKEECDRFPGDISYNTGLRIGLANQTIDYFGLRVAQVFYQSLDVETLDAIATPIPVVLEQYEYVWDTKLKFPLERKKNIYFYTSDGELSKEFKVLPKTFYSASDRMEIVYYRRQSIVNWLIARATELGLGKPVKDYFALYKDETDKYILYGDTSIFAIVQNSTESWLDLDTKTQMGTVRNSILISFTKALEPTPNAEITAYLRAIGAT